jgi:hypothetical protein
MNLGTWLQHNGWRWEKKEEKFEVKRTISVMKLKNAVRIFVMTLCFGESESVWNEFSGKMTALSFTFSLWGMFVSLSTNCGECLFVRRFSFEFKFLFLLLSCIIVIIIFIYSSFSYYNHNFFVCIKKSGY